MRQPVTSSVVAKLLGLTRPGVHYLDDVLQPVRAGRIRLYDLDRVEAVRARRTAERNARGRQR